MSKMITKLIGMVDNATTQPQEKTGIVTPETDPYEPTEVRDAADNPDPAGESDGINSPGSHHQPEDETGPEKPAIQDLAAIARKFNAAFNVALYELDASRKKVKEHSGKIDELHASINTINNALSHQVDKNSRQEEEYQRETELLKQKISDTTSERDRLNQHVSGYEDKLNTRTTEVTQLSAQLETLTTTLEQRTTEGQRAQEEITRLSSQLEERTATLEQRTTEGQRAQEDHEQERDKLTGKIEELQVLFDHADEQLKVQQRELDGRARVITHISRQVDSLTTDLDFLFDESDQHEEAHNQETTRLCADILELNEGIQERDQQLARQAQELDSKTREIAWQNDHISEIKDEIDTQTAALQKLTESHAIECEELKTQISLTSAELESHKATHNDHITHANKLENLNRALHESSIAEKELHRKIQDEKDTIIASLREQLESTSELPNLLAENNTATDVLHAEVSRLESRLKETESLQHKLEERTQAADRLEAEAEELRTALKNATDDSQQNGERQQQLEERAQAADRLEAEAEELRTALQNATDSTQQNDNATTIDSLKSEIEKLESLLSASEEKHKQLQAGLSSPSPEQNPGNGDTPSPAQAPQAASTATDRVQFVSLLNSRLADQAGTDRNDTVMYVLLDNFIHIRDEIGIMHSEKVINEITGIISSFCKSDEMVSRFGDCTFVVLSGTETTDETKEKAERICSAVEHHIFEISGYSVITSTSIGICRIRNNDSCAEEVIARADLACEAARSSGGNQVVLNSTVADELIVAEPNEEHHAVVRKTLDENRIIIYYQPISCLKEAPGIHYEVLIRIIDESGDVILPGEFISMAMNSGQSVDIDLYVIENIMKMLAENREQELTLFIKLTSQTVSDNDFPIWLIGKLKEYQVNPGQIVFEVSENTLNNNLKNMSMLSKSLNTIGCKVAIEHYRMSTQPQHLLHIHTDYLKIDSGLIESLGRKGKSFSKVVSIMDVARKNNYSTVAEGVENPASLAILWELGVDFAQGYFIQPPDGKRNYDFHDESENSDSADGNKAQFTIT